MKARLYAAHAAAIGTLALLTSCGVADRINDKTSKTSKTSEALVTVRGMNAQDFRSALLTLSDFRVSADGQALAARLETAKLDLAQGGEQTIARFAVPEQAQKIQVMLRFDDYGGFEAHSGEAGALDARGSGFSFELPASAVAAGGKAQLAVDVGRSLIDRMPDQRTLVPHFELSY